MSFPCGYLNVMVNHPVNQTFEGHLGFPSKDRLGSHRVRKQYIDLCGA